MAAMSEACHCKDEPMRWPTSTAAIEAALGGVADWDAERDARFEAALVERFHRLGGKRGEPEPDWEQRYFDPDTKPPRSTTQRGGTGG